MPNKLWDDCDIGGACVCHPYAGTSDYKLEGDDMVYCRSMEWDAVGAPEFDNRQKVWMEIDPTTPNDEINTFDLAVERYNMKHVESE